MKQDFTFTAEDVREYAVRQLELDGLHNGEHLDLKEYREMMFLIVQADMVQALKQLASSLASLEAR